MSTWGPGGKEGFQHDVSGALPPVVSMKQFIHLEAKAPSCYYFMARALAAAQGGQSHCWGGFPSVHRFGVLFIHGAFS